LKLRGSEQLVTPSPIANQRSSKNGFVVTNESPSDLAASNFPDASAKLIEISDK